jgi:hypothetical protein
VRRPSAKTILPRTFAESSAAGVTAATRTSSASTPPSSVGNEFVASMFRFVANASTGVGRPPASTIATDASTGAHAGWGIG